MPVVIKRYANRKLYNSKTSAYVTLEEISRLVRDGEDITIIDHDSGADITAITLAQVIFDQEKRLGGLFPQSIMSHLIKARDSSISALWQGFDSFLDPAGYFKQELNRRLERLSADGKIDASERERISALIFHRCFEQEKEVETEKVSSEQIQNLMSQLETLELELKRIKDNKNKQ